MVRLGRLERSRNKFLKNYTATGTCLTYFISLEFLNRSEYPMLNLFWRLSMRRDSQLACETDCLKSYNWAVIRQSSWRAELSMKYSDKYERTPLFYKAYHQPNKIQMGRWKFAGHFCNIFHSFIFSHCHVMPSAQHFVFCFPWWCEKKQTKFQRIQGYEMLVFPVKTVSFG